MKKQLLTGLLTLAMGIAAQAVPITGNITFFGTATLDTASAGTATKVTGWNGLGGVGSPFVAIADGNFLPFVTAGDAVTFAAPWSFNSGALAALWAVDGFTFDLISSSITSQGGSPAGVVVNGTGTLSGHGFTATQGSWSFTTQDPSAGIPAKFTFSAAGGFVPDGGSTVVLLGAALAGLGVVRRSLKK